LAAAVQGCAVYYQDPATGAEHVWGIGHLVVKVARPEEDRKAIVRGVTLCGVAVGIREGGASLSLGWERQQTLEVVDGNTAVRLEGPTGDLLHWRVGATPQRKTDDEEKEAR